MKQISLLLFTFCILIVSCQKENGNVSGTTPTPPVTQPPATPTPPPPPPPAGAAASNQVNVAYGTDALQKMDYYLPQGRSTSTTKVMILIHGGAWSTGDKNELTSYIDTLQRRFPGYAFFNLNYRLITNTNNFFPTQENDVKAAVEFIFSKRGEYLISDKFVLLGLSAGAHLGLLQAYKNNAVVPIKAVASFYGPTDMAAMYNDPASGFAPPSSIARLFNNATPTSNPTAYMQSSSINYVTAQSAPTIIFHGGMDPLVKATQATTLRDKLTQNNVPNSYVFYPSEGHGWFGATLSDSFDKLQTFLNLYVQ